MKVGSLVECVKPFLQPATYGEKRPKKGLIYTVRSVNIENGKTYIRLEEIINECFRYRAASGAVVYDECEFNSQHFRELQPPMEINISELIKEVEPV